MTELTIISVKFGLTRDLVGNYVTAHLDAEAAVDFGESPEQTLEQLKDWVSSQLGESPDLRNAHEQLKAVRSEYAGYLSRIQTIKDNYRTGVEAFYALKKKYLDTKEILRLHGVEVQDVFPEDPEAEILSF